MLPDERDESDATQGACELPVRKKPSVIQMTFNGIAYLVTVSRKILTSRPGKCLTLALNVGRR